MTETTPPAAPPVPDDAPMPEDVRDAALDAVSPDPDAVDGDRIATAEVAWRAGLAARRPAGVDREAALAKINAELAYHTRGRIRTDRDGHHRTNCSCGWAGSPWQRDDHFGFADRRLTAREALEEEWRQHVATALAPLLGGS